MHVRYARWALVCFMTAAPAAAQSAGSDTTGLAHIRAALERAPTSRLQVNMPTPTFKVVIEREHFPDLLSTLRSGTGSRLPRAGYAWANLQQAMPKGSTNAGGIDLLSLGRGISGMRHAGSQTAAQDEVRSTFSAFCASLPAGSPDRDGCR